MIYTNAAGRTLWASEPPLEPSELWPVAVCTRCGEDIYYTEDIMEGVVCPLCDKELEEEYERKIAGDCAKISGAGETN